MKRKLKNLGFTMAEMLIVVAIIVVLGGVGFIAVQRHQRSLTQLERDAVAREIFVAAQNHLSMAKSEEYQGLTSDDWGTPGNAAEDEDKEVYYIYSEDALPAIYNQILPFGAIDATVLANNYIIRYQPKAALVLDVFYWTMDGPVKRFDCNDLDGSDYADLVGDDTGDKHANYYDKMSGKGVLGWFGGESIVDPGKPLVAPSIEVVNAEKLYVTVKDTNTGTTVKDVRLKLIITGNSSDAKAVIELKQISDSDRFTYDNVDDAYTVVLDDITTSGMHFADINSDDDFQRPEDGPAFIPGENITVQAVAYSNAELTAVAYSGEWMTNSLFAEISQKSLDGLYAELTDDAAKAESPAKDAAWSTAKIGNMRHLENLNAAISALDANDSDDKLSITNAMQISDLDWGGTGGFLEKIKAADGSDDNVTVYDAQGNAAAENCFVPVTPSHMVSGAATPVALNYNGMGVKATVDGEDTTYEAFNYAVKNVAVDNATGDITIANGGLFDTLTGGSVKNLELVDFTVNVSGGSAGALAGTAANCAIDNVLAHNSTAATDARITASAGAGGLVGAMEGGTLSNSAAALIVTSTAGDAGGLVGKASGAATVESCYSGGHTTDKQLDDTAVAVVYDAANYNVTASAGNAGGLIGDAGDTDILHCYSTCSATGKTAGGLIGTGSGDVTKCYATGLVNVTADTSGNPILLAETTSGAFAGVFTGTATDCSYFEIINELYDGTAGYDYLPAIAKTGEGDGSYAGIAPLDSSAAAYNSFSGAQDSDWQEAVSYSEALKTIYQKSVSDGEGGSKTICLYNLKTVSQLGADPEASPEGGGEGDGEDEETPKVAPAYFVATHYGDWPAPETFVINAAA